MATRMDINAQGFNNMIRELKKINKQALRPVVRAVTKDVLASAAKKTNKAKAAEIDKSVESILRKPFDIRGVGSVGVTWAGKVWVNLESWPDKSKWALLNRDYSLSKVPKRVWRTGQYKPGSLVNLGSKNISQINSMIKATKAYLAREKKHRKSMAGLSKASWYHLMRLLKLEIPANAPRYAVNMRIPRSAAVALRAWENVSENDDFSIRISNTVQACLNTKANGITAFELALNGQVKNFEKRMKIDAKAYARQFAQRHGFSVN